MSRFIDRIARYVGIPKSEGRDTRIQDALRASSALYQKGRMQEAEAILRGISFTASERETPLYADFCMAYGSVLAETGKHLIADTHFERAKHIYDACGNIQSSALAGFNRANVMKYSGATRAACEQYYNLECQFAVLNNPHMQAVLLLSIASACVSADDAAEYDRLLSKIKELVPDERSLDYRMRWSLQSARARLALAKKDGALAVDCLREGLLWAKKTGDITYEAEALSMLASCLLATGDLKEANVVLREAEAIEIAYGGHVSERTKEVRGLIDLHHHAVDADDRDPKSPRTSANPPDTQPAGSYNGKAYDFFIARSTGADISEIIKGLSGSVSRNHGILCVVYNSVPYVSIIPDFHGTVVLDTSTLETDEILSDDHSRPQIIPTLRSIAGHIIKEGVRHRLAGDYALAIEACYFALHVAILDRRPGGVAVVAGNLFRYSQELGFIQKGAPNYVIGTSPQKAIISVLGVDTDMGGALIGGYAVVDEFQGVILSGPNPDVTKISVPTSEDDELSSKIKDLLARIRVIAVQMSSKTLDIVEEYTKKGDETSVLFGLLGLHQLRLLEKSNLALEQKLLPMWTGGGIIGPRPAESTVQRRSLLKEIAKLSDKLGREDLLLVAIYGELTQVYLSEIMANAGLKTTVSEKIRSFGYDDPPDLNVGLELVLELYQEYRKPGLMRFPDLVVPACKEAFEHLTRIRGLAVASGTGSAHIASYEITKILGHVGHDFVSCAGRCGIPEVALEIAEQTRSRALVDWMGRTHRSNHLIWRTGIGGSIGEVAPVGIEKIKQAAHSNNALILYYITTCEETRVCLITPNGSISWEDLKVPEALMFNLSKHLPYRMWESLDLVIEPEIDTFFLGLQDPQTILLMLDDVSSKILPRQFFQEAKSTTADHLVIIADDQYDFLPFACLRMDGRYLVEKFELSYWPSVTSWLLCDVQSKLWKVDGSTQLKPVVVGNPTLNNPYLVERSTGSKTHSFDKLPASEEEARKVAGVLGVEPITGEMATVDAVFFSTNPTMAASEYIPIMHVASHAILDMREPESSFLALADRALTAGSLYRSDQGFRIDLVALSCCQTGLGYPHPDSAIGLTNAFLVAGACSVLSTLWYVSDGATERFMSLFYHHLVRERSVTLSTALATVQRRFIDDPATSHPFYWAAFKLTGSDNNPLYPSNMSGI
jgi:tetratricopeptide (TPR) repeat protein